MKAAVNIICYKHKTLKNGEHPLMIHLFNIPSIFSSTVISKLFNSIAR